jgi:hypothetical protein
MSSPPHADDNLKQQKCHGEDHRERENIDE